MVQEGQAQLAVTAIPAEENMITERYVTDEKGRRASECHGVPASQWFEYVRLAITRLSQPEWRNASGISPIKNTYGAHRCSDPDCKRLNRRFRGELPQRALYYIDRDIPTIRPSNESEREAFLCYGHPHQKGNYLCRNCAIVGTAKRLIQEAINNGTIHKRRESTRGGAR